MTSINQTDWMYKATSEVGILRRQSLLCKDDLTMAKHRNYNSLIGVGIGFIFVIINPILQNSIILTLFKLGVPKLVVIMLASILPILILLEVFLKPIFVLVLRPLKFYPVKEEDWEIADPNALAWYVENLKLLGFRPIMDYGISGSKGIAKVFAQDETACFAEIQQLPGQPLRCMLACSLTQDWSLSVISPSPSQTTLSIIYGFLKRPKGLMHPMENSSIGDMYRYFLRWRTECINDLGLESVQDVSPEFYKSICQQGRLQNRKAMVFKSMTLCLIKSFTYFLFLNSSQFSKHQKPR